MRPERRFKGRNGKGRLHRRPKLKPRPRRTLAYCALKMVLTMGSTLTGTLSQELRYYDRDNNLVAKAHRFLRPDGRLAASGLVDPKRVRRGDVMYILRAAEPN